MPKGGRAAIRRPVYMMKRKVLILCLVLAALLAAVGCAAAESTDPIVCEMELNPDRLTGPGPINVTITISNSSDEDMRDPVLLYDPSTQLVSDFGTNGAALLKAGESVTWTGTYDVNQRMLENGTIVYFVKYSIYRDSGEAVSKSQAIRKEISMQSAEASIEVTRTISPSVARENQQVVVIYNISNTGTISLLDVTIQENADVHKDPQTIPELAPGLTAEIKYPVTMGKKDLTSGATITYKAAGSSQEQTYTVEDRTIAYGESTLDAKLTASAKGVEANGKVTLTLELTNKGSVNYSDLRVTDPTLGDVFTNQQLEAGKTLTLEREITLPETMNYQFTVTAIDSTGTEMIVTTDAVTVTAVNPEDALALTLTVTPDRTEVFEQPGRVRFTIEVANNSNVEAKEVAISHGGTTLYTFDSIPAGETRTFSRDTALSMAGKYQFTATAKDPLDSTLTFNSNEMQIAFSVPTPAPATPTPAPDPTPEPTFSAATIAPITDRSVGTVPKAIQMVLLPVLILAGVLLIGSCVLLVIATKRRADAKKAAENAIDQLERAKRRDYVSPVEPEEPDEMPVQTEDEGDTLLTKPLLDDEDAIAPQELPHLKYARSAAQQRTVDAVEDDYSAMNAGYYDEDMASVNYGEPDDVYDEAQEPMLDGCADDGQAAVYDDAYEGPYDDAAYEDSALEPDMNPDIMYEDEGYDAAQEASEQADEAPEDPNAAFRRPQPSRRRSKGAGRDA